MFRLFLFHFVILCCGKLDSVLAQHIPIELKEDILAATASVEHYLQDLQCNISQVNTVQYYLYNSKHPKKPTRLNQSNLCKVGKYKTTVFIIHGWISNPKNEHFVNMRKAYLQVHDYNVIMVDWSELANELYSHAYCALPVIAEQVAQLLCRLDLEHSVPLNMTHLVGHSLGAKMSGLIGDQTRKICQKSIDRITGLDPASLLFDTLPTSKRLDASDATFVQVIHTNGGEFGYLEKCGHVDFYVNCGKQQLGCPTINMKDIYTANFSHLTCSHSRSLIYMEESIRHSSFIGVECHCPEQCCRNTTCSETAIMGEKVSKNVRGSFYVHTSSSAPFALKYDPNSYRLCTEDN